MAIPGQSTQPLNGPVRLAAGTLDSKCKKAISRRRTFPLPSPLKHFIAACWLSISRDAVGEFEGESVNAQITKLIQANEQTATSGTIRGVFRKAGLETDTSTRPFKIRVVEEVVRANPGFREAWERNVSIDELSIRRQQHRFGIINSEFLER
jgi:hypothetical protein